MTRNWGLDSCSDLQESRQAEFFSVREKIIHVWEELEINPEKPFEIVVSNGDIKNFVLSDANMKMLVGLYQEVGIIQNKDSCHSPGFLPMHCSSLSLLLPLSSCSYNSLEAARRQGSQVSRGRIVPEGKDCVPLEQASSTRGYT